MTATFSAADIWADVAAVRQKSPLVHSISNMVTINFNANVLLAAGASPVMSHAHEEVRDMVAIVEALVINIGTLDPYWVGSMKLALAAATQRGIPAVLEPVGAGATPYRNPTLEALLAIASPTVIRGNGSEIMSMAGAATQTRGVDSSAAASDALNAAQALVRRTGRTVCVSGEIDHVLDAKKRWARLSNGHAWMTKVTGVGCSATALVGAFCAVQPMPGAPPRPRWPFWALRVKWQPRKRKPAVWALAAWPFTCLMNCNWSTSPRLRAGSSLNWRPGDIWC